MKLSFLHCVTWGNSQRMTRSFSRSGYSAVLREVFEKFPSRKKRTWMSSNATVKGTAFLTDFRACPISFLNVGRATCERSLPDFSPPSRKQKAANRLNPIQRRLILQTATVEKQRSQTIPMSPRQSVKTFSGHNSLRSAK